MPTWDLSPCPSAFPVFLRRLPLKKIPRHRGRQQGAASPRHSPGCTQPLEQRAPPGGTPDPDSIPLPGGALDPAHTIFLRVAKALTVQAYVETRAHAHIHTRALTHVHTRAGLYVHACMCMRAHMITMHIHARARCTYMHTRIHFPTTECGMQARGQGLANKTSGANLTHAV